MFYKLASGRLVRRKLGCYKSGCEDSPKTICRLPWAALVYQVWIDRDLRVHHVKIRTKVEILKAITFGIRSSLLACIRFNNSVINETLCWLWRVPVTVLA